MAISNKFGEMLISTGNKSEISVGYTTIYGDMNGGFCALKDAYKTDVYKINSNGKRLHAVRIERYQSKTDAEKIGRSLKSKFGLDFRVINSPK